MPNVHALRTLSFTACAALALAIGNTPTSVRAEPGSLAGSWSGGGTVIFSTGSREKARCKARFTQKSKTSYTMSATCATPSGSVVQTATLVQRGANKYTGTFRNAAYNVSGSIAIIVNGSRQTVTLSSNDATASLRLSR